MKPLRILIAADNEIIHQELPHVISEQPSWTICSEAVNKREAVAKAHEFKPDIIIMDYIMPELKGLEATRQIHKQLPEIEVLVLGMHDSEELIREILTSAPAATYSNPMPANRLWSPSKPSPSKSPTSPPESPASLAMAFSTPSSTKKPISTPREREIVQLVAEGNSTKQVTDRLGISIKTRETHRTNIVRKLDIHSVSDLVRFATRNKIVDARINPAYVCRHYSTASTRFSSGTSPFIV